ncbi:hypothetical protein QZH41_018212, partial [Actinostola sp. cb2023]
FLHNSVLTNHILIPCFWILPALVKKAIRHELDLDFVKKVKIEYKGEKVETRILALSAYRVYIVSSNKTAGKVESSFHILGVQQIESLKPLLVNITAADKIYAIKVAQPKDSIEIIAHIQAALKSSFPTGNPDRFRLTLGPAEEAEARQEKINNLVNTLIDTEADTEVGPCGGFSKVYACMCNYYGSRYLEEVAWDVDTIYLTHNTKEFNLQDFDHLDQKDLIPIIAVLEYNSWFNKLICKSFKLSSDACDVIYKVVKKSTTLEELVLDGVSLGRDFFHKVGLALTSNPKTALHSFDFSNNAMEDRGLSHLTGSFNKPQGLVSLSLVDNGLTVKGILSLVSSLKNSKYVQSSLKRLNLSKNPLKAEGVTTLSDFLAQPNSLTHLDLSYTDCALDLLFAALMRGCVQNLMHLNLAGNNFTTKKKEITVQQSFQQFFSLAQDLKFVDLSNCKLPPEAVRALLKGFSDNDNLKDVELDISKNELKSPGAKVLADSIPEIKNIKKLNISDNGFEGDFINILESLGHNESIQELCIGQNFKARTSNAAVEAFVQLVSEENSHIQSLSLADSKLKQDVIPLLDCLGTNESLIKLDISGNSIGDDGARILAKALQLNSKLRTLVVDKNNISHRGFSVIAAALESNYTLYSIPSPLYDAAQCLKSHGSHCEQHLRKIEAFLLRNQSPHKKVAEQAYRLQQGLLIASTQQQAVDRLIVHLQDNLFALRHSKEENVQKEVSVAKQYIQDADKLKQLLLKFHLCTDDSDIEAEFSKLSEKFYQTSQDKIKDNLDKMLECARDVCPYITSKEDVEENMALITVGNQRLSQTFVEEVILSQAAATILNRIREHQEETIVLFRDTLQTTRRVAAGNTLVASSLSLSITITLLDHALPIYERELLLKEHRQKQAQAEYQDGELDNTDDVVVAARKAKNRISSALLVSGENSEEVPRSHRRRPTISKPRRSFSEENIVVDIDLDDVQKDEEDGGLKEEKKSPMVTKKAKAPATPKITSTELDFSAVEHKHVGLDHLAKSRPRPAHGRRLPTRPSNRPQVTNGVDKSNDEADVSIDSFWAAPSENEPVKTHTKSSQKEIKAPAKTPPRPAPKPAPKPRPAPRTDESDQTTHEKDDKESKKAGWIPRGGINLGLPGFFKKKRDRSGSGNEADQSGMKTRWFTDDKTKGEGRGCCFVFVLTRNQVVSPFLTALKSSEKDKKSPSPKSKETTKSAAPPKPAPPRDRPTSVLPPKPAVKPRDRSGSSPGLRSRTGSSSAGEALSKPVEIKEEETVKEKPATRGPPKFGIGIGGMAGGGLLAEMKMRQERAGSSGSKVPPETVPKPARRPSAESRNKSDTESKSTRRPSNEDMAPVTRPRVSTGESDPDKISEEGLVRPSSIKRPRTSSQTPPKPQIKPRDKKEDKEQEETKQEEKKKPEKLVEAKKEEPPKGAVLKLGEEAGESVDGVVHEKQNETEEKGEKLKLKVKPDDTESDLWVKRDMPSPKRSPKSPKSPALISTETQHIKSESKPMSPITRAATLPKPWSPSSTTTRSLPRKYSFEGDRKVEKDEAKVETRTERTLSIDEEKESKSNENNVEEKSNSEGLRKSVSPFRLPPRKTSSKESKDETPTLEDEDKKVDQNKTESTDDVTDDVEDESAETTPKKDEEKPDSPMQDKYDDPLGVNASLLSTDSINNESPKKKERPISA